jgi:hypothetical protein
MSVESPEFLAQNLLIPISKTEIKNRIAAAERRIEAIDAQMAVLRDQREIAEEHLAAARALKPVPKPRIDTLKQGVTVTLFFDSTYGNQKREEDAVFLGIEGDGDDRHAKFLTLKENGDPDYDWEAYRFEGHWAYGSSAERLVLVAVKS